MLLATRLGSSFRRGFSQILLIIFVVVGVLMGGSIYWFSKPGHDLTYLQEIVRNFPKRIIPSSKGCYYQTTECVKAPCDPVLVCPNATPTSDASHEPNGSVETANWKTYRNSVVGFSIKYPDKWGTPVKPPSSPENPNYADGKEKEANIIFGDSLQGFQLSVFPFSGNLNELINLGENNPYDKTFPYSDSDHFLSKVKDFKVGGKEAVWYTTSYEPTTKEQNGYEIWFTGSRYGFILDVSGVANTYNVQEMEIKTSPALVDTILSTFKFTK